MLPHLADFLRIIGIPCRCLSVSSPCAKLLCQAQCDFNLLHCIFFLLWYTLKQTGAFAPALLLQSLHRFDCGLKKIKNCGSKKDSGQKLLAIVFLPLYLFFPFSHLQLPDILAHAYSFFPGSFPDSDFLAFGENKAYPVVIFP